jgi:hypothetical protein
MTNEAQSCISCRKAKADRVCGLCEESVCRACATFLEEGTFAFLPEVAPELQHSYYCPYCNAETLEPALTSYQEKLEQAKAVFFFFEGRKKPIPLLNKAKVRVEVPQCGDRDETILRLAFKAVELGFNAIVEAEVSHAKVRDHGWQKMQWSGHGIPALVDGERLDRHFQ